MFIIIQSEGKGKLHIVCWGKAHTVTEVEGKWHWFVCGSFFVSFFNQLKSTPNDSWGQVAIMRENWTSDLSKCFVLEGVRYLLCHLINSVRKIDSQYQCNLEAQIQYNNSWIVTYTLEQSLLACTLRIRGVSSF